MDRLGEASISSFSLPKSSVWVLWRKFRSLMTCSSLLICNITGTLVSGATAEEYASDVCSPFIPTRIVMSMKVRPITTGAHPEPMVWKNDFVPNKIT